MAQVILPLALSGSRKADGSPNAGGKVWGFQLGTSSAAVLYKDWQKLSVHPTPVILDGAGKAEIWVDSPVDLRIEDSNGALIQAITAATQGNAGAVEVVNAGYTGKDPNTGTLAAGNRTTLDAVLTSLATSLGGTDGLVKGRYGASSRKVSDELEDVWFNVKRFGAKGNNSADDTVAIQSAVNAALATAGGTVYLPPGQYRVSSPIVVSQSGVSIRGQSRATSIIRNVNGATSVLSFTSTGLSAVSDLAITNGTDALGAHLGGFSTAAAITVAAGGQGYSFTNLVIENHAFALSGSGLARSLIQNVDFYCRSSTATDACISGVLGGSQIIAARIGHSIGRGIAFKSGGAVNDLTILAGVVSNAQGSTASTFIDMETGAAAFAVLIGCYGASLAGGDLHIGTSNSEVLRVGCLLTVLDDRAVETPSTFSVDRAAGTSFTPRIYAATDFPQGIARIRIRATSAGTVTVGDPGPMVMSSWGVGLLCIEFFNNSGGVVTWTLNAAFHTTAAVAPANGSKTQVLFVRDDVDLVWLEVARATVT